MIESEAIKQRLRNRAARYYCGNPAAAGQLGGGQQRDDEVLDVFAAMQGRSAGTHERYKRKRLCRYIAPVW